MIPSLFFRKNSNSKNCFSRGSKFRWLSSNTVLVLLLGILVLKYIPLWLRLVLPYHDTLYAYQGFYLYYNEFFVNNELLQWIPYGQYGVHATNLFQCSLTPSRFFVGAIGLLFRVTDTLLLFNLALFIDECILLIGVYLLAKTNFKYKLSIFFVCLVVLLSSINLRTPYLNFQIYYTLPLILYFVQKFFDKAKLYLLLIGMNIFIFSLIGSTGYSLVIQFLPINIFSFVLLVSHRGEWKRYAIYSKHDLQISAILFMGMLAAICALAMIIYDFQQAMELLSHGRNPETLRTMLDVFFSYGQLPGQRDLYDLVIPNMYKMDYAIYTGMATLIFFLLSLFSRKTPVYYASLVTISILVLFSLGSRTPLAEFLYWYYPGMKYYRHIGHAMIFWIIFFPLLAGFGFEGFLRKFFDGRSMIATAVVVLLMGIVLLQLGSYQLRVFEYVADLKEAAGSFPDSLFRTYRYQYHPYRTVDPPNKRARDAEPIREFPKSTHYVISYNFSDWDPDVPSNNFRVDYLNMYVAQLIRMKGGKAEEYIIELPDDDSLRSLLGCESDKIKIFTTLQPMNAYGGSYDLSVKKFAANQIDIQVVIHGPLPAWLYYADAWHPAWQASVNGKKVPIIRAVHAFKAVPLESGLNNVTFIYDNPKIRVASYIIIFYGILWILAFIFLFVKQFKRALT